ncbi:UDP-N-acetylglucosamine acyltransferase [Dysgonomonas sp. PH5-45]|uniref:acyl-ACP--UDP-N-acetylglucosamine O-acyltransferase n=1 Tax=unclassified Dysgonomonas TaxID=2630389 RepID=UPI0024759F67|nr:MULTISPECIES: acyl-ACP--UDP-N-acetylglucosamine O-acyltransferase [unclassified Dysgonomonas]MDH6353757.1 UDP-N-acetylglucosamine acyltransferase [Dysgonomonas sp. PH5-45]MDH6386660.1 UDP-N-acetylglucosamine acyltransferase [Dysgonomonas sp. PH5-37]
MSNISNLAYIHPDAIIGNDVTIEPFAYVENNVEIGDGTRIMSNANIRYGSRIGKNCVIFPSAVIGAIPQDLKFRGEETLAIIGDNTTIRECCTVNRGTAAKGKTVVGDNCLLMACSHVAHDCILKNRIIIGNATQLAGEVEIFDNAILSGGVLVHQFTRIGEHVMIQGGTRLGKDIPPFVIAGREPVTYSGINLVGLRRSGFTNEQINQIQEIYRVIYQSGLNFSDAVKKIEQDFERTPEMDLVVRFIKESPRGIVRGYL